MNIWTKDWWIVVFCGVCCTLSERPAISRDYHDVTSNNHNVNANHSCTVCFHQAFDCFFVYYFVKVILCSTTFAGFFFFFMSMILNFWFISTYNNYMRFRSNSDQNEALTLPSPSSIVQILFDLGGGSLQRWNSTEERQPPLMKSRHATVRRQLYSHI